MKITALSISGFLFELFACAVAADKFIRFSKDGDLEGFTCPADQTGFFDNGKNSAQCLLKCSEDTSCYGVFYQSQAMSCIGCNDKFLARTSAPPLDGTHFYRRMAYKFIEKWKTWNEAKEHCEDLGGYLADIKSEEEETFIKTYVLSASGFHVWLGATDEESEGNFVWQDGTSVVYENWGNGEPSQQFRNVLEHCLLFVNYMGWIWRDHDCDQKFLSLCEFN